MEKLSQFLKCPPTDARTRRQQQPLAVQTSMISIPIVSTKTRMVSSVTSSVKAVQAVVFIAVQLQALVQWIALFWTLFVEDQVIEG
jgi:hypothetical protein